MVDFPESTASTSDQLLCARWAARFLPFKSCMTGGTITGAEFSHHCIWGKLHPLVFSPVTYLLKTQFPSGSKHRCTRRDVYLVQSLEPPRVFVLIVFPHNDFIYLYFIRFLAHLPTRTGTRQVTTPTHSPQKNPKQKKPDHNKQYPNINFKTDNFKNLITCLKQMTT